MKQADFLNALNMALGDLPLSDKNEIMTDYQAYFDDALNDGRSEEEISKSLGEPRQLARELRARHHLNRWEDDKTPRHWWQLVLSTAAIGVLNLALAVPMLLYFALLTGLSILGIVLMTVGLLLTLLTTSNMLFDWPNSDVLMVNTSGIGPMLITEDSSTPEMHITNGKERFDLQHAPDGSVILTATDADGEFYMEKAADGHIKKMQIKKGVQEVNLAGLHGAGNGTRLGMGLLLLLIGSVFLWLSRRLWSRCMTWLREYLDGQVKHLKA